MEETLKQYVIRPINRNRFSGKSFYDKTYTVIMGAQLGATGVYKTGLTASEEAHYEQLMNLAKGTLNKRNSEFWGDLEVRLKNDGITIMNVITPLDEIKHRVLLEHDLIANTEHDVPGNPGAKFYIYDPEAASKIEATKMEFEFAAMEAFHNATIEEKRNLLRVYGKFGVDNMSETMVKAELYKFVKNDFKEFIRLTKSKETTIKALLQNLIEKQIIKKKGNYYYNGEDLLGSSTDEVVAYLSDIKNQTVKLALEGKLKPKKASKKEDE